MENLCNLLITSSIYATVTGLLILIIKLVLKNKLTPKWVYILWLVFILKLIIPFGPESNISIFNKIKINNQHLTTYEYKTKENEKSNPPMDRYSSIKINDNNINLYDLNDNISPTVADKRIDIIKFISLVWAIGFIIFATIVYISYLKLVYKLNEENIISKRINRILIRSKHKTNISKHIELIINKEIENPSIFGINKPKILFPIHLMKLSDQEIEFIFLHELCHYKRRDNYLCSILLLLQLIHWFNPFIWYLFKIIRQDIELATDYKVSEVIELKEIKEYGYTLLTVLSNIEYKITIPILISMVNNKKDIEERIMNIKKIEKIRKNKLVLTLVGVLTVGVISPLVLTNSNNHLVYGNTKYTKLISNGNINFTQNKYFELTHLLSEDSNMSLGQIDKFLLDSSYIDKSINKENFQIIYKYKNEEIIIYKSNNQQTKVNSIVYNIYNPSKDITLTSISCDNFDEVGWKYSIKSSTPSAKKINEISTNLNSSMCNSTLFENYNNIVNNIENGNKLEDKLLYNINSGLNNKHSDNPGINYYQTKLNNQYLTVCNVDSTKNLESMSLSVIGENGIVTELLDTYNISQSNSDFINRYNLSKDDVMVHSLSLGNKNLNEIKDLLLKSIE